MLNFQGVWVRNYVLPEFHPLFSYHTTDFRKKTVERVAKNRQVGPPALYVKRYQGNLTCKKNQRRMSFYLKSPFGWNLVPRFLKNHLHQHLTSYFFGGFPAINFQECTEILGWCGFSCRIFLGKLGLQKCQKFNADTKTLSRNPRVTLAQRQKVQRKRKPQSSHSRRLQEKMARRVLSVVMVAAAIAALLSQSLSFLAAPKEVPRSVVVPAAAIAPALPGTKNDNQRFGCCKHAMWLHRLLQSQMTCCIIKMM